MIHIINIHYYQNITKNIVFFVITISCSNTVIQFWRLLLRTDAVFAMNDLSRVSTIRD